MAKSKRVKKSIDIHDIVEPVKNGKTEAVLLQRFKGGDAVAFEQIYYRWNKPVYGFMLRITRSESDSEEITQEVFTRLWNMRESIDPERNFQALVFTIARRIAVDMYRRRGRLNISVSNDPEDGLSLDKSPQEVLEEREANLLIDIAVESMSARQRQVFSLYYYHNLPPQDIASTLGLSYDNVRKHIYNAKRQLREAVLMIIALMFCF